MRYIAFLRGMNLGKRRIAMSRLRELFEELGYREVETFIASGNVLFVTGSTSSRRLEAEIARRLEGSLGYSVDTFVRTAAEVGALARRKIFAKEEAAGGTVHVGFLQEKLPAETARKFAAVKTDDDEFRVTGTEYFWLCRGRVSESKVWSSAEMKALRLPTSTARNMTTIRKLAEKHLHSAAEFI